MANTKISQLPSYTGTAADLRWFVMNNSGETETYKYSGYSSPFLSTGTTNKVIQPVDGKALLQVGSGNTFNDYSGSNLKNAVVIGDRNKVDGAPNTPVMFIGNDLDSQQFGSYALHIGNGHYASGSYNISVGDSGIEMNGSYGLIIGSAGGSQAHKSWGTYNFNLGQSNQTQGITGAYTFGRNHTISSGSWGGIFGGTDNSLSSSNDSNSIVGGSQNSITNTQLNSGIFGVFNSSISGLGAYNSLVGGATNGILNNISSVILGGSGCLISGNTSPGANSYNSIISSRSSTIPGGLDHVSMIATTSGRTATATTYVENIHSYRTPSTEVQPVVSGTVFTCNIELGGKSQFYITGTSTINITNVRDGASFMIKTQTDGNYNITWTATGYTFVFEGGLKDPGNNVTDIFVFEVFGSVIYGNRRHNYS